MPVVLMSLLSPLVFVLPEDSGERVSYAVTLLLSLAVFMGFVASLLPQTSEPLSLCIVYMFVLLIHSGLCVVCSVVHLRWEKYKREQSHASYYCEDHKLKQDTSQNDQNQQNAARISHVNLGSNTSTIGAEFFDADKDESSNLDILTQNGFAHHENVAINHQLKEVMKKGDGLADHVTYRRPLPRSCESIWNANVILLVFFYVSWFAVSMYFLVRLL
ncbi:acetylcholine receptor subunit alpha [Plakobranchus ocellatus]|uniref:Acetylcholine receptor subunit alpha n=1 Tax=Plakobranchus ocellatus TaxID=259542 RepID=A0AAV3YG33_9GAST|nr:acetylcholine receptor subunit alpha [Plakobranchus ocellatus]